MANKDILDAPKLSKETIQSVLICHQQSFMNQKLVKLWGKLRKPKQSSKYVPNLVGNSFFQKGNVR